jgi:hypothetical protein
MKTCGYIIPRQHDSIGQREDYYLAECILRDGHKGPHLVRTPEGRFFSWEFDENCNCEDCLDHEDSNNRCYLYWEVPAGEVEDSLKNRE